ncbi:RsbRD N-terminal domain-containing protein [Desulfovibrio inopinatus]|uniref:RsbRD N-terminal domain-containing protein n=1 Tax=Desulfovibrio inopinatus TaxID=102109 RepID=UPI0004016312|nr:RsbRD N-terminal domain-containing protein [Desulfovibrio inopinatus]
MTKKLPLLIAQNRAKVEQKWFDAILSTYAPETATVWKKEKNRFANPVCHAFSVCIAAVIDYLVSNDADTDSRLEAAKPGLEEVVRIRAVQNFAPSEALTFLPLLKKVVREMFWNDLAGSDMAVEFLALESRIDVVLLLGLDIYSKCREKLFALRIKELKNTHATLLRRANLVCELSDTVPKS